MNIVLVRVDRLQFPSGFGKRRNRKHASTNRALAAVFCALLSLIGTSDLRAHGAYHDVVRELKPKIAKDPKNEELRLRLAAAHVDHDEWKLALAELDRIEKLAPGKHELGYLRGRSLATAKRWKEARQPLDEFIAKHPDAEDAHLWRGRVLLELKETDAALADFRKAALATRDPEVVAEAARTFQDLSQPDQAVSLLQDALKRMPDDPALLNCLVNCATKAGKSEIVLATMETLRRTWPRPEEWMRRKAAYLAETGKTEESKQAWQQLLDHIEALPNLERAQPFLVEIQTEAHKALGTEAPKPVIAPPAP
jgi:tetratricopeptide (TPR) repeat protein